MHRRFLFALILLCIGLTSIAAKTTISGTVPNAAGFNIRLLIYKDQISNIRETLASSLIGPDGAFNVEFDISSTRFALLDIDFQDAEIYIQPGGVYKVSIKFDPSSSSATYFDKQNLEITFLEDDAENLNRNIQDLNQVYNDFMIKNFSHSTDAGGKPLMDSFRKLVNEKFSSVQSNYFNGYLRYLIASMEQFMRLKSRKTLGSEYLTSHPILYENIEYMDFFNLFFEKYLLINNKYLSYGNIYSMIKLKAPARAFLDSLKKDPVLSNNDLRELVFLSGLKELYEAHQVEKDYAIELYKQVKEESGSPQNKEIASNLIERLNHLSFGTKAPSFNLKDTNGNLVTLDALKGEPVYLCFFISSNSSCEAELAKMSDIFPKYKSRIHFISISADKKFMDLQHFLSTHDYPWTICWAGDQVDLLESYDAWTFPLFILIDPTGHILKYPAPLPSEEGISVLNGL